jgi:hypothetical protein
MSASHNISTEEEDLEEGPVTALSVEQEQPLLALGDNGNAVLSTCLVHVDCMECLQNIKSSFYEGDVFHKSC